MSDGTIVNSETESNSTDMYEQMNTEKKKIIWNSWIKAVSGKEPQQEPPKSKTELVKQLDESIDSQLEAI